VTALIKVTADSSKLPGLNVFWLQLFIPLAALRGLVLPEKLHHADHIEPAEGLSDGSFSILNEAGFERHRHADTLFNVCGQVGLPRRLSLGECLTCESHRSQKRYDLFLQGQDLFHLFLMGDVHSAKRKRCNSNEWESMSNLESDPPVEDAGATEKQPEKQPEEEGSQQPEGLVVPALNLESDPPVEDAGVTEKQPEEGGSQQPEGLVVPALDLESDPPVEDAGVTEKQPEEEGRKIRRWIWSLIRRLKMPG
jgi:hypothetical protein